MDEQGIGGRGGGQEQQPSAEAPSSFCRGTPGAGGIRVELSSESSPARTGASRLRLRVQTLGLGASEKKP